MTTSASGSDPHAHWRRNQVAVTVAVFIGFASFTLVMPFLPLYFEMLGVTDPASIAIWSGVSLGVTPAITAAVAPMWARIAERFGRKLMVARSLLSFVIVMSLLAAVRHPWQVLALRALLGFFAGYGTLALVMAAESSPAEHMATAIGWVQTAQRLGPALGPVIGGILAQTVGLRETFVIAAGCYLLAFLLVIFGYEEVKRVPGAHAHGEVAAESFRALRAIPHFTLFLGTVFGLQLVDRSFGPILPLFLGEAGVSAAKVPFLSGVIFTVAAGAAAAGNQLTSWFLRRYKPVQVLPASAAFAAVGALVFGFGPALAGLLVSAAVFGFGVGLATTTIYTAAGRAVGAASRGAAFGYLTTAYLLGLAVSPVVAGFIGAVSTRTVFFVDTAGLIVVAWIVKKRMMAAGGSSS
jgi:DHA1 family multidrug resistance protein-like MFS transporter